MKVKYLEKERCYVQNSPIVEYLEKKNELLKEFLVLRKIRFSNVGGRIVWGCSLFLAIFALILAILINSNFSPFKAIFPFIILFISYALFRVSLYMEIIEIRKQYPQYNVLLSDKPWKNLIRLVDKRPFLIAFYSEKLNDKVNSLSLSPDRLSYYIEDFSKLSEKTKNQKWYTFAILGIFLFSIWNELVGAIFGNEENLVGILSKGLILFSISIIISLLVSFYKTSIEQVMLKKAADFLMLSEVLKIIKNQ